MSPYHLPVSVKTELMLAPSNGMVHLGMPQPPTQRQPSQSKENAFGDGWRQAALRAVQGYLNLTLGQRLCLDVPSEMLLQGLAELVLAWVSSRVHQAWSAGPCSTVKSGTALPRFPDSCRIAIPVARLQLRPLFQPANSACVQAV